MIIAVQFIYVMVKDEDRYYGKERCYVKTMKMIRKKVIRKLFNVDQIYSGENGYDDKDLDDNGHADKKRDNDNNEETEYTTRAFIDVICLCMRLPLSFFLIFACLSSSIHIIWIVDTRCYICKGFLCLLVSIITDCHKILQGINAKSLIGSALPEI